MEDGRFFGKIYSILDRKWIDKDGVQLDFRKIGFVNEGEKDNSGGIIKGGSAIGTARIAQIAKQPDSNIPSSTKRRLAEVLQMEIEHFEKTGISEHHFDDEFSLEDFTNHFIPDDNSYSPTALHSWVFSKDFNKDYCHETLVAAENTFKTYKDFNNIARYIRDEESNKLKLTNEISLEVYSIVPHTYNTKTKKMWIVTVILKFAADEDGVVHKYYGVIAPNIQPHMLTWHFFQQDAVDNDVIMMITDRFANGGSDHIIEGRDLTVSVKPYNAISHNISIRKV